MTWYSYIILIHHEINQKDKTHKKCDKPKQKTLCTALWHGWMRHNKLIFND